jgi:hypothetical protein
MVKVEPGCRVSVAGSDAPPPPPPSGRIFFPSRRYGFVVALSAAVPLESSPKSEQRRGKTWTVRFDDGAEAALHSAKLKIEHVGPTFGSGSGSAAFEALNARYLPPPSQRQQRVVAFDAACYDFRGWFLRSVLQPAAEEDAAAMRAAGRTTAEAADALRLPPAAAAPPVRRTLARPRASSCDGDGGGGGGTAVDGGTATASADGGGPGDAAALDAAATDAATNRLLSNLHLTPGALLLLSNKPRATRTPWHRVYARTLRTRYGSDDDPETAKAGFLFLAGFPGGQQQRSSRAGRQSAALLPSRRLAFEALLRRFVREQVAPLLGCGADDVAYQAAPTLRVSHPSEIPAGHPHCDSEYGHQPAEMNIWLPLTEVWGGNTLHAESAPGRGDFAPFELGYGRFVWFWGNQCRHYATANDTGFTRVSLDLRVLDLRRFNPAFVDAEGHADRFRVGQYYATSRLPPEEEEPPGVAAFRLQE